MTLNDSVLAFRLHVLAHAKRSGNVSATCRELGVSRTLFYRWKKRLGQYGRDGLHPTRQQARRGRPPNLSLEEEQAIVALALSCPAWGLQRLAIQLARQGRALSPSSVYRALRRMGLGRRTDRLLVLEQFSAVNQGLVTERTRRQLGRRRRRRHVEVTDPGELVCLDTFYIGKLKGVGKVWQLTACDAASSYAAATIIPAAGAEHTARFLQQQLIPLFETAGWPIQRGLTDRGSEFKGAFDEACRQLGIRHTRIQPRHAWTNGFVERLQGTILQEHWRVAFRRSYFTNRRQLHNSLDRYLAFYNDERPHLGYRTRGRTPSEILWGVTPALER